MSNRRREIFESVRDKAHTVGLKFEDDPTYLAAVEDWIAGKIAAAELRKHYQRLLDERDKERRVKHFIKHCLRDGS
ncbi:hypothetical protein IFT59_07730 [Rhizobium sp. CFBP 8752]|nr:hypothetical protein [Rhizobium sp. CFBP 8752]